MTFGGNGEALPDYLYVVGGERRCWAWQGRMIWMHSVIRASRQFMLGEPDGQVPFHYHGAWLYRRSDSGRAIMKALTDKIALDWAPGGLLMCWRRLAVRR